MWDVADCQVQENQNQKIKRQRKSWWGRHCWPDKRRALYKHVTIITMSLQLLNLLVLTVIDAWPRHEKGEQQFLVASSATMIILQVLNLCLLVMASGRLLKQIYRHSVNNLFLAQAYLATLLLFAGIYTTTFRLQRESWRFVNEDLNGDPAHVFVVYAKFLFYSISTATLCGSSNVLPLEWYNCIFAGIQMLLSFCYFASILGIAMTPDVSSLFKPRHSRDNPQEYIYNEHVLKSPSQSWSINQEGYRSFSSDNTSSYQSPA